MIISRVRDRESRRGIGIGRAGEETDTEYKRDIGRAGGKE